MIEEELRKAARREPRHAAVDAHTPEGESPIPGEPVEAKKCRFHRDSSHGLDGIAHDLADLPDLNHKVVILRAKEDGDLGPPLRRRRFPRWSHEVVLDPGRPPRDVALACDPRRMVRLL